MSKQIPMQFEVIGHYPKGWNKAIRMEGDDGVLEPGHNIEIAGDKYFVLDVAGYEYVLDRGLDERLVNQDIAYADGSFAPDIISEATAEQLIERVLEPCPTESDLQSIPINSQRRTQWTSLKSSR